MENNKNIKRCNVTFETTEEMLHELHRLSHDTRFINKLNNTPYNIYTFKLINKTTAIYLN